MRRRLLVIPADSISNRVSRSYYLCKYLSERYDLYVLSWHDPQSIEFQKGIGGKINTLICFFRSLFQSGQIVPDAVGGFKKVFLSRISHMVLHRIIGTVLALKITRAYNGLQLRRITKKLSIEIIFYADGFDSYPRINGSTIAISDIQDDFDSENFRFNRYQQRYGHQQFCSTIANYIVTPAAKEKLEEYYNCRFDYLPNGAEIEALRNAKPPDLEKYNLDINLLSEKRLATYIGGRVWYDKDFANEVFAISLLKCPDLHFITIGNLSVDEFENVTHLGPLPSLDTYGFYKLSDFGLLLRDSSNSMFLRNSMPLKIIQYSATGVKVIVPTIEWLRKDQFNNVFILKDFSPSAVVDILSKTNADRIIDQRWLQYDWKNISAKIDTKIRFYKGNF